MKRVFIAVNLPGDLKKELTEIKKRLSVEFPSGSLRWVTEENLHVTLVYIGTVKEERISELSTLLEKVDSKKFKASTGGLQYVPDRRSAKLIWVDLEGSFGKLRNEIISSLENFSISDDFEFKPHITLARTKSGFKRIDIDEIPLLDDFWVDFTFSVESFDLMESRPGRGVPDYKKIKRINLT